MEVSECFVSGGCYASGGAEFSPEKKAGEHFAVEDLFDFSNEDVVAGGDGFLDNAAANSADSSTGAAVDSCNSSLSGGDNQFSGSSGSRSLGNYSLSGELCVPYDDLAELEWLSNFVEDSFSTKHSLQQPLPAITGPYTAPESSSSDGPTRPQQPATASHCHHPVFLPETPLPSKSRSKRSRAAPCDWTTRLLHLTSPTTVTAAKLPKTSAPKKQTSFEPRKCLHCASEKTPQWRTGPMGPKTLCNACGVRYKSGRLVPEYRPAASPTFMSTKHSNSHSKVLELRRQKELQGSHQHHQLIGQNPVFAGFNRAKEYLIDHAGEPGFRQLI